MGKRDDICSMLGYEKDNPIKERRNLLKATSAFLADYEARGNKVYGKKAESIASRLCAVNFLEEEGRGERFWPLTSDGSLIYEETHDKEVIIDHIADLFLTQAKSNYSKLHTKRRSQKHNATPPPSDVNNQHVSNKPPASIEPEETYSENEEPHITYSSSLMTIKPELCLAPWLDPPKRFDRNVAIPWAESLNPRKLPDPPVRLGKNWLSQENVRWPGAVDKEIQYFMHRWVFYYTTDLEDGTDDGIQSLVNLLRNDTSASTELEGTQLREFRKRIVDRVKFFTEAFINNQIVEVQSDGAPRMTQRFRAIWTTLKYETPTPRINHRRRSVEEELPRESPRKRRKLSKKAEDNAMDANQPKRKPWSENAWRRKTIPPPADMTFPNLLSRKSSNNDPVTSTESPQNTVDEEGSERGEFEICEGSEIKMRNSKMSVEIPPRRISSECDVMINMEDESTIEVSPFVSTVTEISDDESLGETIKVLPLTPGEVTKPSSSSPDNVPGFQNTPLELPIEGKVPEAKSTLPDESNVTSENRGLSQQHQVLEITTIAKQSLENIPASPMVNELVDTQAQVISSAQLSPRAESQNQVSQDTNTSSFQATHENSPTVVRSSIHSTNLDEEKQSPIDDLVEPLSQTQGASQTGELLRVITSTLKPATQGDGQDPSNSTVPSANNPSEIPEKYGPFQDPEILNRLFSSNGSQPVESHRPRSASSISPTSSSETKTREIEMNLDSVNAIQNTASPRTAPSIDLVPNDDLRNKQPSQSEIIAASQLATERLKNPAHNPNTIRTKPGNSSQIPSSDVLETLGKSIENPVSKPVRTPLPSVPSTSTNNQKKVNLSPTVRQAAAIIKEFSKPIKSPPKPSQQPVPTSQASYREPSIPSFQPINRPMNVSVSTPSNVTLQSTAERPQSPVRIIQQSATSSYHAHMAPHGTQIPNERKDIDQSYKQIETMSPRNVTCEHPIPGTLLGSPWTGRVHHNLNSMNNNNGVYPMNSNNGVYPMAFTNKSAASNNDIWMQEASRKRPLEQTNTKSRKTKSRKKAGASEKLAEQSAHVHYPAGTSAPTGHSLAPSTKQAKSPPHYGQDPQRYPKPPHPELISQLRLMDEQMGANSGASHQSTFKAVNQTPSRSNQQLNNPTEKADQNISSHAANQNQDILKHIALQEEMHSNRDRSSQDWGKTTLSADVHNANSVTSPAQPRPTFNTSQVRPSLPNNPQITSIEQVNVDYGIQTNNPSNIELHNQSAMQQNPAALNPREQTRINNGVGTAQNRIPSKVNAQTRVYTENWAYPPNPAHTGYSEEVRPLETEMRHESTSAKGTSVVNAEASQNYRQPQDTQNRTYNYTGQSNQVQATHYPTQGSQPQNSHNQTTQNHSSSPESYRSEDPWWNNLAANYNITKRSQPPSRSVSHSDTNVQQNRSMNNATPALAAQSMPPAQAKRPESLHNARPLAPQVSEHSRSTGSQASKIIHNPEGQRTKHSSARPSNTQGPPPQNYHGNQYATTQPSPVERTYSTGQNSRPTSAVQTSIPNNQFSNHTVNQSSNRRTPSPKVQGYQPPSHPLSRSNTSSNGQFINHTTAQLSNVQNPNYQRQPPSNSPIQSTATQNSVSQHQFSNRPPTHFSPIQAVPPQNQNPGSPVNQASPASVSYNSGYNERQNQTAPQYPYPKRPQQPVEPQTFTMQAQQEIFNGQKPHDWTQYRLKEFSPPTTALSGNSSPRQPSGNTSQAAKIFSVPLPTVQIQVTQSSPAPTISTILNPCLPPTPPTPAAMPTSKQDPMLQYPPKSHSLTGISPQQAPVIPKSKVDNLSNSPPNGHPLAENPPRHQTSTISIPRLDNIPQYSPPIHALATPQPTPTTPQASSPKLDFYLQQSNAIVDTTNSFSYQYMETLTLSNLFIFFSQRSGIPLDKLDELTFRCMFGEYQQFVVDKRMGDGEWKKARKRIWRNWDREVRAAKQSGEGEDEDEEFWEVNILVGKCA